MHHRAFRVEFEVPDDWDSGRNGSRTIYHGPRGEELIVSGAILEGAGPVLVPKILTTSIPEILATPA